MPHDDQSGEKDFRIDQIRIGTEIIDRVIRWLSPLLGVLVILILVRAVRLTHEIGSSVQVILIVIAVVAAFSHQHLKPSWRIYLYIAATAVIGIIGTFNWGLMGAGHAAVLLSMIFASILGIGRFAVVLGLLLVLKITVALVWIIGKPHISVDLYRMMYEPSAWGLTILGIAAAGCAALVWEGIFRKLTSATDQLRESEKRYKEIFNAASDALILYDETGKMVDANDAAYALFNMPPQSDPAYTMNDFTANHGPYSEEELEKRRSQALAGTPMIFEGQSRKLNGQAFPSEIALRATRIRGKPRLIASVRDSTERKKAEEETAALHNQLFQAQKIETVGRLAGGIAHDFNNMLSVMLGHLEMVLEQIQPGHDHYKSLREIQKAAQRSAELTRQLLAYARRQTISPKVLHLNDTLSNMITLLKRLIGETVEMVWVPGDNLWPVKVDPSQLNQILSNLCVNARDAIRESGTITIQTQNITLDEQQCQEIPDCEPGEYVMLSVEDNGSGMDTETMGKVFEPFFTTKKLGEGTGLGLSTVFGIVKQHNGYIQVKSQVSRGTSFHIYFPRCRVPEETMAPDTRHSSAYGPKTILLVEDEPSILNLGKLMLEKLGYRVIAANSPGEAIQKAEVFAGAIDLLITDVVMPEMNGRELAKRLLPLYPDMKRLFMSGYTADVIALHGVLDEGVQFMQKPFTKKDLMDKVGALLDTHYPP